jgi:hypothetical protein
MRRAKGTTPATRRAAAALYAPGRLADMPLFRNYDIPLPRDNPAIPDGPAKTPLEQKREKRRASEQPRGTYAAPGTGPLGETCGSCRHATQLGGHRTWYKCAKARRLWTNSVRTDIRLSTPACIGWEGHHNE